ncbi:MAG TPA: primosomal protein N', partial [Cytophagaceae bacterium]
MNQDLFFEERSTVFADVILPLPLPKMYTYRVSREMEEKVVPGARVVVQFGQKRVLTAIVANIHNQPPALYEAKYLLEVLDDVPSINSYQLKLFDWISEYYMCHLGEVLNAGLPSGMKISSESQIQLHPEFISDGLELSEKEEMVIAELRSKNLSYNDLIKILGTKNIYPLIKSLIQKHAIILYEEIKEKYSPKTIRKIRLNADIANNKKKLEEVFQQLEKKVQQTDVLLKYLQEVPVYKNPDLNRTGITKSTLLLKNISTSSLNTLVKNKIFEEFDVTISRFADTEAEEELPTLTENQQTAFQQILKELESKDVCLFRGITGSGKTEIYIHLIKHALEGGNQALLLLPEIALTTQIVKRLAKVFGNKMGVYHSKFSDNERVEVWNGLLEGKFSFIIGVRSSIFLPFDNLGLVIIDEEHETSYKQYDPAPRYHARDTALMLARLHNAKAVLGSATPSIESYYNAKEGKWGLVSLLKRYGNSQLPDIELIDLRVERKNRRMRNDFSNQLLQSLETCIQNNEQAIVFQNRRGYAPFLVCEDCGHIQKCQNCSVSLTYHLFGAEMRCHYCGHKESVPSGCVACGSVKVKTSGAGTEKIEDELKLFIPNGRIQRMDLDTTRRKSSYENIINEFEKGETNILVGTQMISKGLDFGRVSTVAIFDADRMIHFPDFRSYERAFQMITQVSGRAGRREKKGKVVIQTHNPD